MATNQGLKRLRLCKFPLFLVALIAIGMVIRVPLSAMTATTSPDKANRKVAQQKLKAGKQKTKKAKRSQSQPKPNQQEVTNTPETASVTPQASTNESSEAEPPLLAETPPAIAPAVSIVSDWTKSLPRSVDSTGDATQTPLDNVDVTPSSPDHTPPAVEPTEAKINPAPIEPAVSEPKVEGTSSLTENETIILRNPTGSGGPIQFLIDSERKLLEPGDELRLPTGETYRLRFHRGGSFGNVDQQLVEPGVFNFVPTPQGWKIR